ncbi:MAG: glycosyltransferase family 4 protein [Gammaproteobacteria bacterium]|nr:glycosyltransferase family 4 protein [Gammaproteobacteria bacterium]
MRRKHVLFVSTRAPYPLTNGHNQRTYNILKQISRYADVSFFGFFDKELDRKEENVVHSEMAKLCVFVHLEHVLDETNRLRMFLSLLLGFVETRPYVAKKYYSNMLADAIRDRMNDSPIDIVHLDMLPLAEYLPLFEHTPVVLTNHNVEAVRLRRWARSERNPLKRLYLSVQANRLASYESAVMRRLSFCVAVSEKDKAYLQQFNSSCRVFVVPNGTDTEKFRPRANTTSRQPTMLWVGSMSDPYNRSGINYFVKNAFESILSAVPNVQWTVVGRCPPLVLRRLQSKYPNNVSLQGFVGDVRPLYDAAHVFIAPLISGSGTKLKVIEGLAMGKALVTTSIGAEGLAVKHGEHLLIADDPQLFAEHVIELLNNGALRQVIGAQARTLAEQRYDWCAIGELQRAAYKAVLEER